MDRNQVIADAHTCPCGHGRSYANCCKPLHMTGYADLSTTAEMTMRARYSAYVLRSAEFLLATWHSSTRPSSLDFSDSVEWHGLEVISMAGGGVLDATGTVEFRARFRRDNAHLELHELSTFRRENGRWFYVDGLDPDE